MCLLAFFGMYVFFGKNKKTSTRVFCSFFYWVVFLIFLTYIFWTLILCHHIICKYFPLHRIFFPLLMISFAMQQLLSLIRSHLLTSSSLNPTTGFAVWLSLNSLILRFKIPIPDLNCKMLHFIYHFNIQDEY